MPCDILLVTTPPSFGELIQQTLQETGHHRVVFVNSGEKAIFHAQSISFAVAILDADVEDIRLSDLMERLISYLPGLRFIVIPRDNRIDTQEAFRLPIETFLMKPFYLPDLVEMVSRILPEEAQENAGQPSNPRTTDQQVKQSAPDLPPWLTDEIKDHFPKIREENPSGDFWAPGYLSMTQIASVSDSVIQNFIHQIRQYQGASTTYSSRLRR